MIARIPLRCHAAIDGKERELAGAVGGVRRGRLVQRHVDGDGLRRGGECEGAGQ